MKTHTLCRFFAALLVLMLTVVCGCYPPAQPVTVPIETIRYEAPAGAHRLLLVYLPGYGDKPSAFDRHGLIQDTWKRGIEADVICVNAHLGYYLDGSLFTRLKEDVIDPAKAEGYKHIWLVGNSLGAYGSISYARVHPGDVAGVVLLGPFVGERKTINEIRGAGGLRKWDPGAVGDKTREDWEKRLWLWLKDYDAKSERFPAIYLGYGKFDRFSYGQDFLAHILPPTHVVVVFGGHDWAPWREAWDTILGRLTATTPEGRAPLFMDRP